MCHICLKPLYDTFYAKNELQFQQSYARVIILNIFNVFWKSFYTVEKDFLMVVMDGRNISDFW